MKRIIALALTVAVAGCASTDYTYTNPGEHEADNQVLVEDDMEIVWDRLINRLSSDLFIVNHIDDNAKSINLSFMTQKPTDYVDCGVAIHKVPNNDDNKNEDSVAEKTYTYDPADSAIYTIADSSDDESLNVERITELNGVAKVTLTRVEGGTQVNVDATYVIDLAVNYFDLGGQNTRSESIEYNFTSTTGFKTEEGVSCQARGNLEESILSYAQ